MSIEECLRAITQDCFFSGVAAPQGEVLACLAPHPDDESAGPGGSLVLEASQRPTVVFYLTDGARGMSGRGGEAKIRRLEAEESVRALGVTAGVWMGLSSARVKERDSEGVARLGQLLRDLKVHEFWIPSPYDHHPTHVASTVFALDAMAVLGTDQRPKALRGYGVWDPIPGGPDVERRNISAVLERKRRSILVHESQVSVRQIDEAILGLNHYEGVFQEVTGSEPSGYAESFLDMNSLIGRPAEALVDFVRDRLENRIVKRLQSALGG